ncbi:MAG: hypothetical protein Q8Q81_11480 [Oxalobacteraceae bacterium]|nr:hypothetical protein [Oxalobacteraceae bacterium]
MNETIVIFANSVKHGLHCVAGKSISNGAWVRLVADENGSALNHEQAKYTNPYGRFTVKPLQKITMDLVQNVPLPHQPENHISGDEWTQAYTIGSDSLRLYADTPETLWGTANRISQTDVINQTVIIEQSLYLVNVENISFHRPDNKRRISFSFNGHDYDLPSTDPNFDALEAGTSTHNNYLCVSLGEDYQGYHYKIIATIL